MFFSMFISLCKCFCKYVQVAGEASIKRYIINGNLKLHFRRVLNYFQKFIFKHLVLRIYPNKNSIFKRISSVCQTLSTK